MNTPAPAMLGLSSLGMGGFGAPGGMPSGLEGLFALLLGTGQPGAGQQGMPSGLLDALLGQTDKPLGNDTLLGLLPQNVLEQLDTGNPEKLGAQLANLLSNQGEPGTDGLQATMQVNLQAVVVELQEITVKLTQAGVDLSSLGDSQQLAAALVKMGMTPEEAAVKAAQIDTMLRLVREMLGLEGEAAPGDLLAQMMAAGNMLNPAASPVVQVEAHITTATAEVAVVQMQVSPHHARARMAGQGAFAGADLAREMAGITMPADASSDLASTQTVQAAAGAGGLAADTADAPSIPVAAAVPAAPAVPVNPATPIMVESAPAVQAVEVGKEIKAPAGVEVLTAKVDEDDNLQVERRVDALTLREAPMQTQAQSAAKQAEGSFAERLGSATRADTTQQVVVQVKELAGQGGGTVRMVLSPPELGEIRIEMVVSGGKVEGRISATDSAVVELLARDVHSLKQSLGDLGLKLGDNGLALMLNNGNQQQAQPDQRGQQTATPHQGGNGEGADTAEEQTPDSATAARWVSPDRVLDMNV